MPYRVISGNFLHPETLKKTRFKGVILQKQHLGAGFFLGSSESGSIEQQAAPAYKRFRTALNHNE